MIRKNKLLLRAKEHIFSTGVNDAASRVAQANMQFGLAKMHLMQKKLGMKADATFVSTPDETVTRNAGRWNRGIAYGGKISWGNGKENVLVLDVKPNACGMIVGGLDELPSPKELLKRVYETEKTEHSVKGVPIKWDFNKGNHFIDVFKVDESFGLKLPPYITILHAGCAELKGETEHGVGLYHDYSSKLRAMMHTLDTPFGPISYLLGNDVKEFMKFHDFAVYFSNKRRQIAFKEMFDGNVILNKPHQYMLNKNEIALGCNHIKKKGDLCPISIRADLPSYLARGKKNLTMDKIKDLGFYHRAQKHGVMNRLLNANLAPHGGGYQFPDALDVTNVFEINGTRFFEMNMANEIGKKIIQDVREIQFLYRGRDVMVRTVELGLADIAAKLTPVYVLKI